MKPWHWGLAFTLILGFILFFVARERNERKSWLPEPISQADYEALCIQPSPQNTLQRVRFKELARQKGFVSLMSEIPIPAPDGTKFLAFGDKPDVCYTAAILSAKDGRVLARLPSRLEKDFCDVLDTAFWSPNGSIVAFKMVEFKVSPLQFYDAQSGRLLWESDIPMWERDSPNLVFSPDSRFILNTGDLNLFEARTGKFVRALHWPPKAVPRPDFHPQFSRDGKWVLLWNGKNFWRVRAA